MPTILEIIKEYFELTGRPIATLTVSEYLEFYKNINKLSLNSSDELISTHSQTVCVNSSINNEKKKNLDEKKKSETIPSSKIIQKPSVANNALAILQSVNG